MINSLYIKDYAIIDELAIEFKEHLNIFLGETGSGKSIIIGAIDLITGARGDQSLVRKGKERAYIEAVFSLNTNLKSKLAAADIEYEDELIVSRTIGNRNSIKVNNHSVTLAFLNTLFEDEIDIHSQKDSQYLLKTANHRKLLDIYLNDEKALDDVKAAFNRLKKIQKEYQSFLDSTDSQDDIEYCRFQLNEIKAANLSADEEEELLAIEKKIKNAEKMSNILTIADEAFNGEDGIKERLYEVIQRLNGDDAFVEISDKITNHYYELDDLFSQLTAIYDDLDISAERINEIQERLFEINRLKRKYHMDIAAINDYADSLAVKITAFENLNDRIAEYEKTINEAHAEYHKYASILSDKRKKAAASLREAIIREAADLELKYFDFKVDFKKGDISEKGNDEILFLISTNKGEELKPLNKVSSGGEMSRIMLGLKTVFGRLLAIAVMIFDEIDTGISGKAADAVGMKLAAIAQKTQVMAITHSPNVAAFGDSFYEVSKKTTADERTSSIIYELTDTAAIKTIASMIASDVSAVSLKMAEELISSARTRKDENR